VEQMQSVCVVGAGAIGSVYGSMIHTAHPGAVSFLADSQRAGRLSDGGVVVNGTTYHVPAVTPQELESAPDLIILAVKYHHLPEAVELIEAARGEHTTVLSILNGIDSEEILAGQIGWEPVLYGMALGIDAVRLGNSVTCSTSGRIYLGRAANLEADPTVRAARDLLESSDIATEVPKDMLRMLWWKFMINIGMNQVSAVLGAPYREFQQNEHAIALSDRAMQECVAVAEREGIGLSPTDIEKWHEILGRLSPDGKTSMLQDVEAGRKTEVEMFAGQLIDRAGRHGLSVPLNESLLHMIKVLEARYLEGG